jgi:DNA repair protein RecO (recombination protein O)
VQSGIAKGALRPKSRFGYGLELLSEGVVDLYHRDNRDLQTLGAFDVSDLHRGLAQDLGRFAGASALAQVLLKMAPPSAVPAAYDALVAALQAIERAAACDADAASARGLWLVSGALGFEPSLETCVRDGAPITHEGSDGVAFSAAEGGVFCARCAPSDPPTRLPPRAYQDLLALNDPAAPLPTLDDAHAAAHRRLVARFVRYHLEEAGPLTALDFWERRAWTVAS